MNEHVWQTRGYYEECYGFVDEDDTHCNFFNGVVSHLATDPKDLSYLEIPKIQAFQSVGIANNFREMILATGDLAPEDYNYALSWKVVKLTEEWFNSLPTVYNVYVRSEY